MPSAAALGPLRPKLVVGNGTESATVFDLSLPAAVPCTSTASTSIGSTCAVATSANAITPGFIQSGKRTVVQLSQIRIYDGGADGNISTRGNSVFETEGVFVP